MLNRNRKMLHRLSGAAAAVALALTLAACGGGSDDLDNLAVVATTEVTAPASAVTTSAVVGTAFTFASGVPELSTTSPTTLTFTGASTTAPAFKITSTEGTATGTTEFGSCIFKVVASTFPSGHPLALGASYRVATCAIYLPLIGVPVGTSFSLPVQFVLGAATSAPQSITVLIEDDGDVQINNTVVGQTNVGSATGATGGGS